MSAQWSPRRLEIGAAISVVQGTFSVQILSAYFVMKGENRSRRPYAQRHGFDDVRIELDEEGIKWCRGYSGPEVDALKVSLALVGERVE